MKVLIKAGAIEREANEQIRTLSIPSDTGAGCNKEDVARKHPKSDVEEASLIDFGDR